MSSSVEVIGALRQSLVKFYKRDGGSDAASAVTDFFSANEALLAQEDVGTDLEVVMRELFASLLGKYTARQIVDKSSGAEEVHCLLHFALSCALGSAAQKLPAVKRVPFLMLEDLLEGQTVTDAEAVWTVIESLTQQLMHNKDLFAKGSNILLRMCNSLLRRISKSCHTELCGRVLLFLAALFPISERSAVNLTGKLNTANTTAFEPQAVYEAKMAERRASRRRQRDAEDAEAGATTEMDSLYADVPAGGEDDDEDKDTPYADYRAFWQLQALLSEGRALEIGPVVQQIEAVLALFAACAPSLDRKQEQGRLERQQVAAASSFFQDANTVPGGHSDKPASASSSASSSSSSSSATAADGGDEYLGCKFLTSSELFSLQLRDPLLRQQVCTQILILLHNIKTGWKGLPLSSIPQATVNMPTERAHKDVRRIEAMAWKIVETTPGGAHLKAVLLALLQRESRWARWKTQAQCASFERAPLDAPEGNAPLGPAPPAPSSSSSSAAAGSYSFGKDFEQALETARALVAAVPSLAQHMEAYIDAEDPEAGIEADYHPKKQPEYCWRARRLLAAHSLKAVEAMTDGDVGRALRFLGMVGAGAEPEAKGEKAGEGAGVVAGWLRETMAEGREPEAVVVAKADMEVEGTAESKAEDAEGGDSVEGGEKGGEEGEETAEGGPRKRQRQTEA